MKLYNGNCQQDGKETSHASFGFLGALILGRGWERDHSDHDTRIIPLQTTDWFHSATWHGMSLHRFIKTPSPPRSLSIAALALEHEDPVEGYLRKLGGSPVRATPLPQMGTEGGLHGGGGTAVRP